MTEVPEAVTAQGRRFTYSADARLLRGHLVRPVELKIESQSPVSLRDTRGGHVSRSMDQFSAEGLISFQSGYASVSGSYSEQHGWVTLATSVLEGLNVFEVITAERVVAQVSTTQPHYDWIPKVTFLGTRFENLRIGGYAVQIELDLGICGDIPEGGRSYLEDHRFLDRVQHQVMSIARAKGLPRDLRDQYDSEIAYIDVLRKRANGRDQGGVDQPLQCSLVNSIGPIPIPGVQTFGNLILIPDFGVVSLAGVEVGRVFRDHTPELEFTLEMLKIRMGSIAHGDIGAAEVSVSGEKRAGGGGGAGAGAGAAGLAPPAPVVSSNVGKEKAEGAEGTSVIRYPNIDLAVEDSAAREVLLTIDLSLLPDPRTEAIRVRLKAPKGWSELRIQTEITAPELRFEAGGDSGTIVVHHNAPSEPYRVKAWVTGDLQQQDAIEVHATFYYEGRNCGSARRAFPLSDVFQTPSGTVVTPQGDAVNTLHAPDGHLRAGKVADKLPSLKLPKQSVVPESRREVPPIGYTAGCMDTALGAKPPKLTVEIWRLREPGQQKWHLIVPDSVREECTLPDNLTAEIDLKKDEPKYAANLFKVLDTIESGQHMSFFQGLGDRLFRMTPSCFQQVYWLLFDKYGSFPIQILSDDPYVPWELMRPTRPESDKRSPDPEILARRHPLGRWFLNKTGAMPPRLTPGKVATIAPDYSKCPPEKNLKPLRSAQQESQKICAKLGPNAVPITGRKPNVLELFEDSKKEDIGLVHYAGHGASSIEDADSAQLFLEDTDLRPLDISRQETQLGKNRHSLVFFNACGAGAPGLNLGVVGGFAEALIEDRFGGFIAPLWSVYDVDASAVILEFLDRVLLPDEPQRQTFAVALQKIRYEFGEESPTFLSYTYYGDVMAAFSETRRER
jgi:hypothetical protein